MKEDDDPLFMESGGLVSELEGRQALYLRVNRFPLWISKSSKFSGLRDRLIIFRAVTYGVYGRICY